MQRRRCAFLLLGLAAVFGGCSLSDPAMPLTDKAVDAALTPPLMEVLRTQAATIRHPLLRPMEFDGRDGMTPDQAAILAVLTNPSLRAARDARGLAAAQVLQAGLLPNPSLTVGNDFPFAGPDHLVAYGVGIHWDISALVTYGAKVDAAKAQAASVDLDIAWREWQVAQSAKAAAYDVLSLEAQLSMALQADQLLQEDLTIVRKAVELQQKTAVDLSAAQAAQQESHSALLETQRDLARQKLMLKRLLGLPAQTDIRLRSANLPDRMDAPAPTELQDNLSNRRLDLLALRRGYDSQEATVRSAVLSRFPPIAARASTARDTTGTFTAGYELSVDLPFFDNNQGKIAIEKATRQKLFDEFVNRVFEAQNDIVASTVEIDSLNRQIAFAQSAVPVLERLVADYKQAVDTRNADILSYYSARSDLNKKKIEVIKLKRELVDTLIALENASGMLLLPPGGTPASGPASQQSTSSSQGASP